MPGDVSLVGVDDLPYAEFFDAPLTTFALPGEEIGWQAAELLIRRLGGEQFPPQRIRVPSAFRAAALDGGAAGAAIAQRAASVSLGQQKPGDRHDLSAGR